MRSQDRMMHSTVRTDKHTCLHRRTACSVVGMDGSTACKVSFRCVPSCEWIGSDPRSIRLATVPYRSVSVTLHRIGTSNGRLTQGLVTQIDARTITRDLAPQNWHIDWYTCVYRLAAGWRSTVERSVRLCERILRLYQWIVRL